MKSLNLPLALAAFATFTLNINLHAQPLVTIETVTVGDAGNAADTTGYGAVASEFAIGKYEVTIGQYTTFLNSVAAVTSDSYIVDLWSPYMPSDPNIAGISRSGAGTSGDPYIYDVIAPSGSTPPGASSPGNRPMTSVSWFGAARFANWMNNGATNGASTETGAYTLDGKTNGVRVTVNPGATWYLPSEDQWYKAAYYKGGGTNAGYWVYPTQSDTMPGNTIGGATNQANYYYWATTNNGVFSVTQFQYYSSTPQNYLTDVGAFSNSASAYGTFDQGGNVWEWTDAVIGPERVVRGGDYAYAYNAFGAFGLESSTSQSYDPSGTYDSIGFRVASVPEPSTYALALMGAGALWLWRRRKSAL